MHQDLLVANILKFTKKFFRNTSLTVLAKTTDQNP